LLILELIWVVAIESILVLI